MYSKQQFKLTEKDIAHLRDYTTLWLVFTLLIFVIGLILGVLYQTFTLLEWQFPMLEKLWIAGQDILKMIGFLLLFFLLFIIYQIILYRLDIVRGKKTQYHSENYQIIEKKSDLYIKIISPVKKKIDLSDNRLVEMIDPTKPLTVEKTKYSKTVLFISNDTDNLIDKLEAIDELEDAAFENGKE